MGLVEQGLAVRALGVKGAAVEAYRSLARDGRAVQGRAELLPGAVIPGDKLGGPLAQIHQLCVLHNLLGHGEGVLPGHVLQGFVEALLHAVQGIGSVLSHGLEALHGGHGAHLLGPFVGVLHIEQLLEHALLLERLAPLLQEHADRGLGLAKNAVLEAGALGKRNASHISSLPSVNRRSA